MKELFFGTKPECEEAQMLTHLYKQDIKTVVDIADIEVVNMGVLEKDIVGNDEITVSSTIEPWKMLHMLDNNNLHVLMILHK